MKKVLLAVCVLMAVAGVARALDHWPAPWEENPADPQWAGGVTTAQAWEFSDNAFDPNYVQNEFGDPAIVIAGAEYPSWVLPPEGDGEIATWHINDAAGGIVCLIIPNNPDENQRKVMWLQITSTKAPSDLRTIPEGTISYPKPDLQCANGWYIYTAQVDIPFNPPSESIAYDFPYCTNIEEIVVKTICVPEPATMAMLGLGGLAVLWRKRRK